MCGILMAEIRTGYEKATVDYTIYLELSSGRCEEATTINLN